jgi:tetratricopeptide (TPR) repeat protein
MLAWYNKGRTLYNLDKYDESIQAYDKAIDIDPQLAAIWYCKGKAFEAIGDNTNAEMAFARAKELGFEDQI